VPTFKEQSRLMRLCAFWAGTRSLGRFGACIVQWAGDALVLEWDQAAIHTFARMSCPMLMKTRANAIGLG